MPKTPLATIRQVTEALSEANIAWDHRPETDGDLILVKLSEQKLTYNELKDLSERLGTTNLSIRLEEGFVGTETTGGYPGSQTLVIRWD